MSRQIFIYLIMSILVVLFSKYFHLLIVYIDTFFIWANLKLSPVFSHTGWGLVIRKTLTLIMLPIIITAIPALIYRAVRGHEMPNFIYVTWVVWTIIVLSDILIR